MGVYLCEPVWIYLSRRFYHPSIYFNLKTALRYYDSEDRRTKDSKMAKFRGCKYSWVTKASTQQAARVLVGVLVITKELIFSKNPALLVLKYNSYSPSTINTQYSLLHKIHHLNKTQAPRILQYNTRMHYIKSNSLDGWLLVHILH